MRFCRITVVVGIILIFTACNSSKKDGVEPTEPIDDTAKKEQVKSYHQFPILAWIGVPPDADVSAYNMMKDAGFSYDLMTFFGNADQLQVALDKMQSAGLKGIINIPELETDMEATINRFKHHPALIGYTVYDEPRMGALQQTKTKMQKIQSYDSKKISYVNLLASGVPESYLGAPFSEYLKTMTTELPLQMLSFSYYPVMLMDGKDELELDRNWYESLEHFSKRAEELDIPLWTLNLSSSHHHIDRTYPVPTIPHLRLQVYSNLAYGSQVLQYYTYWTPRDAPDYQAPIKADGTKSIIYDRLKKVNEEVINLSGVFVGAKKLNVWHTGTARPLGTKPLVLPEPFEILQTTGEGAVVSLLENGKRRYLMVVNRSFNQDMSLTVKAKDFVKEVDKEAYVSTDGLGTQTKYILEPGDMRLFSWKLK